MTSKGGTLKLNYFLRIIDGTLLFLEPMYIMIIKKDKIITCKDVVKHEKSLIPRKTDKVAIDNFCS